MLRLSPPAGHGLESAESYEVFAGGAAEAAYGELPPPRTDGAVDPPPPVTLVHLLATKK